MPQSAKANPEAVRAAIEATLARGERDQLRQDIAAERARAAATKADLTGRVDALLAETARLVDRLEAAQVEAAEARGRLAALQPKPDSET